MAQKDKNNLRVHPVKSRSIKGGAGAAKPQFNRVQGQVIEALPSLHFKVKLDSGKEIRAHLAGKLRIYRIRILPGDKVTVEMSPYDENRGRIVYRGK